MLAAEESRMKELKELEEIIGYRFRDQYLLLCAITHSSFSHENRHKPIVYNERLEFLGDSVLSLVVSRYLYENYPKLPEGDLSKVRAAVVCEHSLWQCAQTIELGSFLRLGHGEEMTGGRTRVSILADAFEALIAAIYLDSGLERVREWVLGQLGDTIVAAVGGKRFKDFKTTLQETIQAGSGETISYQVVSESGPDHQKSFFVQVLLGDRIAGEGEGNSKKRAEQAAAQDASPDWSRGQNEETNHSGLCTALRLPE
ncbi:MAG: ribonuclease III [Clostridia bacterium]|nr:ribonuclease III [Clostridia bacterium]